MRCASLLSQMLGFLAEVFAEVEALDDHAEDVLESEVRLLDVHRGVGGDDDVEVGMLLHCPTVVARVGDRVHAHGFGELERLYAVFAVAGGGDGEQDIAGVGKRFHLALKDVVIAVVVADSGEDAGVGRERNGAQCGAIHGQPADELGDEVLGISGRTAVAADHELLTGLHGVGGEAAGFDDGLVDALVVEDAGHGVERLLELAADEVGHMG